MKHNLLHIGIHFHCLDCEYNTIVTPMFLADYGVPVCPECDGDMKISDKYATLYQDKTEARRAGVIGCMTMQEARICLKTLLCGNL